VAREHGVNANQVFNWRKLYRAAQLRSDCGAEQQVRLLPVSVSEDQPADTVPEEATKSVPGVTINIEFPGRAAHLSAWKVPLMPISFAL
jgi:transposase